MNVERNNSNESDRYNKAGVDGRYNKRSRGNQGTFNSFDAYTKQPRPLKDFRKDNTSSKVKRDYQQPGINKDYQQDNTDSQQAFVKDEPKEERLTLFKLIMQTIESCYPNESDEEKKKRAISIKNKIMENNTKYRPVPSLSALLLDCIDFKISNYITGGKLYKSGLFYDMVKQEARYRDRRDNPEKYENTARYSMSEKDIQKSFKALRETTGDRKNGDASKFERKQKRRKK